TAMTRVVASVLRYSPARRRSDFRVSATLTTATGREKPGAGSGEPSCTISSAAPAWTASRKKACPSYRSPQRARKAWPARTERESVERPAIAPGPSDGGRATHAPPHAARIESVVQNVTAPPGVAGPPVARGPGPGRRAARPERPARPAGRQSPE